MDRSSVLALPDDADTASRVRDLVQADPVALLEIAAAVGNGRGAWPVEAVTRAARDESAAVLTADGARMHDAIEAAITGRDVDLALEWMHQAGLLAHLFPELAATVDLAQETGRMHKDVWAHTKQVVKQAVRRPHVRWAALFHDIGKVPTRTYTDKGVHFHGHAEVGARMFDRIAQRISFEREERRTIRFLVKHHLRSNQYSDTWSDSAVRRFHREMAAHLTDLLDLSRADITSKRPGRRKQLLEQISALADRVERLAEEDSRLPPLPGGVGNAIMEAFRIPPSKLIGDLKKALEEAVARGDLEPRREDGYYVGYLARTGAVPGVSAEDNARILAELPEPPPEPEREPDGHDGDPDRPRDGVLDCGADTEQTGDHSGHSH
jgi:poly(A) polymerase